MDRAIWEKGCMPMCEPIASRIDWHLLQVATPVQAPAATEAAVEVLDLAMVLA